MNKNKNILVWVGVACLFVIIIAIFVIANIMKKNETNTSMSALNANTEENETMSVEEEIAKEKHDIEMNYKSVYVSMLSSIDSDEKILQMEKDSFLLDRVKDSLGYDGYTAECKNISEGVDEITITDSGRTYIAKYDYQFDNLSIELKK